MTKKEALAVLQAIRAADAGLEVVDQLNTYCPGPKWAQLEEELQAEEEREHKEWLALQPHFSLTLEEIQRKMEYTAHAMHEQILKSLWDPSPAWNRLKKDEVVEPGS